MDNWQQTYSGKRIDILDAKPDQVCIEDIAHALSLQCRFGGHCPVHYSVAQHSVLVASQVSQKNKLTGLLHDAPEAYLIDLPRPVKRMMPEYRSIEDRLYSVLAAKFGLADPIPQEVKDADTGILAAEAVQLMKTPPSEWGLPEPLPVVIDPWDAETAKRIFLQAYALLTA